MSLDRRDFLRIGAVGVGTILAPRITQAEQQFRPDQQRLLIGYAAPPIPMVRIGFVGVGGMGTAHVENLLKIPNCEILAVCDIVPERVERAQSMCVDAGKPKPEGYIQGPKDYQRLCRRDDLDLVYIATPWEWHVPMCLEAMNRGKHAAVEVPAAITVKECWSLVDTSERTRRHCIMMENCNYDRLEMMILRMVKEGVLGELLYAECGYLHDLREVKHDMDGEGVWRRAHSMKRNGDLYPTHGLGPVAQCFDINRGNRIESLVAFGTKSRGLRRYAVNRFGADSPQAKEKFVLSDIVTTMLRTSRGETIVVKHDTSSPRPYSRDILVQGVNGLVRKYPEPKVHIEGTSSAHKWDAVDEWMKKYEHPIWTQLEEQSKGGGHGGMDFIEDFRLIRALHEGLVPDMDVYDAAMMSAVTELSGRSIKQGNAPQRFPDFTRGEWKKERVLPVMA
jgi:predicted dehydrogenase